MKFEWDPGKAAANRRRHGVDFEQGVEACEDPNAFIRLDSAHSEVEVRFQLIGLATEGILLVVLTMRDDENIMRIISVRPASAKERSDYYENNPR